MDFMSTFGDFAGQQWETREGISFYSYLTENKSPDRETLYFHYPHYSYQLSSPASAIRAGDYKLIEFHEDSSTGLYNISVDPSESHNLSHSYPALRDSLANKLKQWRTDVNAAMPIPNPNYDPNYKAEK